MRVFKWSQVRNWRQRAEECRSLANSFRDEVTRDALLKVAEGYDGMATNAERAETKLAEKRPS